eukprot:12166-Heterococcus_DN1.PRE.1
MQRNTLTVQMQRKLQCACWYASLHVRPITIETSVLPRTHGSALFTRGDTQALATVTLGGSALPAFAVTVPTHFKPIHQLTSLYTALNASSHTQHTQTCMHSSMQQKSDSIDGSVTKKFYLQYTFPPSCVGEVGRVGAPGRREGWPVTAVNDLSMTQVGHGNLAERALVAVLPTDEAFPYSIRVESLITESCGSSSMASVCGGCMAMMDAGVPIKSPIAGVAMGLLLDEDNLASDSGCVLTDILGMEDALGTMDFKQAPSQYVPIQRACSTDNMLTSVAGNKDAITTFQLDIKCEGLTIALLEKALEQCTYITVTRPLPLVEPHQTLKTLKSVEHCRFTDTTFKLLVLLLLSQARVGRLHILGEMSKVLEAHRPQLSKWAPIFSVFKVPSDSIG